MSDTSRPREATAAPVRGEAKWRATRAAIAGRNEEASRRGRARRQVVYDQQTARRVAAERLERAELAKLWP